MKTLFAGRRFSAALLALALLNPGPAGAQATAPTAQSSPRPWFYQTSDVSMDPAWRFGVLANGLRYAIRRNDVPVSTVSIRVRVDVGSLMEQPDEAGFAHFIEHLSFRGSRDVPDGETKRIWQRLGADFGIDTNAFTTETQTSFAVDLPDAKPAGLDESLKILASMVSAPAINPGTANAERSVVMAERRENLSPGLAIEEQARNLYFAGQRLGDHTPIGTEKTLLAATAERLKAFHDRWYRPDSTVVVISGDADPAALEALVKKHFGSWQANGPVTAPPDFGKPDPKAPATRVIVAPDATSTIRFAYLRPWVWHPDTIAFNQARFVDDLAVQLVNRRLAAAALSGASFLDASVSRDDSARSVSATYVAITPIGNNWEKALKDVRAIIEDARQTLPSEVDIDREYNDQMGALNQMVSTVGVESSKAQVDNLVAALDIRETVVRIQDQTAMYREGRRFMTPQQVRDSTRRMFSGDAVRALVTLKAPQNGALARLDTALRIPVQPARNARLNAAPVTMASLPALPPPGKAMVVQPLGALGIEQIVFENGVTLYLNANKGEPGKVRISVRFGHGQQSFSPEDRPALWAAPEALMSSGIGTLDMQALQELTNGRQLSLNFGVEENAFVMRTVSSPADYKDQLRLYATKLAFPRWDAAPLARAAAVLKLAYDPVPTSAGSAIDRNIDWLLRDKDSRVAPPAPSDAAALTLDKFKQVWAPRLATGPIEIQLFGDLNRDEAIAAVAATFGALERRPETVAPAENRVRHFPAPVTQPVVLRHKGPAEQAAVVIAWPTGGGEEQIRDGRQLETLASIIGDRLFERFRSVDGAAYTPSAFSVWPESYPSGGYLMVQTQLRPDRIPYFYSMMDEIIADLAAKPVTADELERQIEPVRKLMARAQYNYAFWMDQLRGLSRDPRRMAVARSVEPDMLNVTAADLQALAKRYLRPDTRWSAVVLANNVTVPQLPAPKIAERPAELLATTGGERAAAN